jgi:hypothetical protein
LFTSSYDSLSKKILHPRRSSSAISPLALPAEPARHGFADPHDGHLVEGRRNLREAVASPSTKQFTAMVSSLSVSVQGKRNVLLFPRNTDIHRAGAVQCRERLGGLLRSYHQDAA